MADPVKVAAVLAEARNVIRTEQQIWEHDEAWTEAYNEACHLLDELIDKVSP